MPMLSTAKANASTAGIPNRATNRGTNRGRISSGTIIGRIPSPVASTENPCTYCSRDALT